MEIAGKPVRNAKKPVVLVITSDDVKKGATRDPASCAAALACKRQMNASEARVHTGRTYVRIKDEWIRFNTPVSLQKEIVAFDRGGLSSLANTNCDRFRFRISSARESGRGRQGASQVPSNRKNTEGKSPLVWCPNVAKSTLQQASALMGRISESGL